MEDKWFVFYEGGHLRFHRSWTGAKIYEAKITKLESSYIITRVRVERNLEIYGCTDDLADMNSFTYLLVRGIFGRIIEPPINPDDKSDVLRAWSYFGRMIL